MLEAIKGYINEHFGSRRGLLNHFVFGMQRRLGYFDGYQKIDWHRVTRLIFICHGNICRSPLGEYVARAAGATSESFGLACREGAPADPRAINFGATIGLDLSTHRSRNISSYVAQPGDLLIVMEPVHLPGAMASSAEIAQVTLAGLWLSRRHPYIHDPFTANDKFFSRCERSVTSAAEQIVARIKTTAGNA